MPSKNPKAFQMGGTWIKLVDIGEIAEIIDGGDGEVSVHALAVVEQNGGHYDSNGLIITPLLMHKVHSGDCWEASSIVDDVKDGEAINILVTVGDDNFHCAISVSGDDSEWLLYEGTIGSGGLPMTPRNLNRTIGDSSPPITVKSDVLVTDYGARLAGNLGRTGIERILKPNTTYLIEAINLSGKTRRMSIFIQGYKE